MENRPIFNEPVKALVERYPSGELFGLQALEESSEITDSDLEAITKVCSEELIYSTLFKKLLEGKPYTKENAQKFIDLAKQGWEEGNKFVFLIRNPQGEIVAAMDIKSNNLDSAEIGYWASENYPGIMTNAVGALCEIAKKAGYKNLYGLTVPANEKSQKVLLRVGFNLEGELDKNDKHYLKFSKDL